MRKITISLISLISLILIFQNCARPLDMTIINNGGSTNESSNTGDDPVPPSAQIVLTLDSQSGAKTKLIGQNVTFSITVTGSSSISYEWFHNNSPIPGEETNTLRMLNLANADAGTYYVIAWYTPDSSIFVQSANMQLTVNAPPPPPANVTYNNPGFVSAGNNFRLYVHDNQLQADRDEALRRFCIAKLGAGATVISSTLQGKIPLTYISFYNLNNVACTGAVFTFVYTNFNNGFCGIAFASSIGTFNPYSQIVCKD